MIPSLFVSLIAVLPISAEPAAGSKLTPLQISVRAVVEGVAKRAARNAALPANDPSRLSADALTCEYIQVAAEVARQQPEAHRAAAFLIGSGIALDDSPLLRTNLLTRGVCAAVESEGEFQTRGKNLGSPTIRKRRDLCQHYAVSLALTSLLGVEGAEAAGVTKELLDAKGGSGFSFVDLAADFSGIELAKRVNADSNILTGIAKGFPLSRYVPDLDGLKEGFDEKGFKAAYGSTSDPRYKAALEDIRTRIAKLEAFKK